MNPLLLHIMCMRCVFGAESCPALIHASALQIATPGGLALPAFYTPMLAPVTPLAVTSLADFSIRHPEGTASAATNEGLSRQCFDRVLIAVSTHCGWAMVE